MAFRNVCIKFGLKSCTGLTAWCVWESYLWRYSVAAGFTSGDGRREGERAMWKLLISRTTDSLSAYSFQCNVCGQRANNSALCVCGQRALVPMVVCYWLVISVGNRSCYQAWHGDRRGWMMHGTGKLFRRKDNGVTQTHSQTHTRTHQDGQVNTTPHFHRFLHTK